MPTALPGGGASLTDSMHGGMHATDTDGKLNGNRASGCPARQPRAHVDQAPGDQVAYAVDTFPLPFQAEQTRFQIRAALPLRHMAPHHHVDETVLVLDGDEGHPAGRLRTLALGDQAGRAYRALVRLVAQAA